MASWALVHSWGGPVNSGGAAKAEPGKDLDELAHAVIGAAIEVHRNLGAGFQEAVYEKALCVERKLRRIPFARRRAFHIDYKGHEVGSGVIDLLVGGKLVGELKTVEELLPVHSAQVISYLKAIGSKLGLLLNFKAAVLRDGIRRVVLS